MTRRPRILHAGPLPPTPSGVADYAADLLPWLAQHVDLAVAVPDDGPLPSISWPLYRMSELTPRLRARFDLPIYQIGNHRVHGAALQVMKSWPGLVVLHDAGLHHLYADLYLARGRSAAYLREVVYADAGGATRAIAAADGLIEPAWRDQPLIERVIDQALGAIVHSRHAAAVVKRARPRAHVRVVHHGVADPPAAIDEPPAEPFTLGVFGGLGPEKRIATVVAAFARLRAHLPTARMLLVGEPSLALPLEPLLRAHEVADAAELTGRVDLAALELAMARCHVCVQLRWPTLGEASGATLRALRLGRPTVVSACGWFAELPPGTVRALPVGLVDEAATLADLILELAGDSPARARLSQASRCYASAMSWPRAAAEYAAFAQALIGDRRASA